MRHTNIVLLYSFKLWVPGISVTTMATLTPTATRVNTVVDIINAGKVLSFCDKRKHKKAQEGDEFDEIAKR